jgi:hypothetical protein
MKPKQKEPWIQIGESVIFDLLLLVAFVVFAVKSLGYNPRARAFPMGLGTIGGVMMLLQLIADAIPAMRSKLRFLGQRGLLGGASPIRTTEASGERTVDTMDPSHKPETRPASWTRVFRVVLWLVGFVVLLKVTHYLVSVGFFIFFLTKIEAKENWFRSASLAAGTCLAFYLLFEVILNAHL